MSFLPKISHLRCALRVFTCVPLTRRRTVGEVFTGLGHLCTRGDNLVKLSWDARVYHAPLDLLVLVKMEQQEVEIAKEAGHEKPEPSDRSPLLWPPPCGHVSRFTLCERG